MDGKRDHGFLEAHGVPGAAGARRRPGGPSTPRSPRGADAIYCGLGNDFNARRGAHNFDDESFAAACRRAHLAGTRVYVTVNVAVSTEEMPRVLGLVRRAWELGADAFIIQDWGPHGGGPPPVAGGGGARLHAGQRARRPRRGVVP